VLRQVFANDKFASKVAGSAKENIGAFKEFSKSAIENMTDPGSTAFGGDADIVDDF